MKKLTHLVWTIATGLLIQSCVSSGTHEKLQQDYDKMNAALTDCKSKSAAVNSALSDCNGRLAADESKIHERDVLVNDLQSKLGSTSSAKTRLEGNVAEMKTALEALSKQRSEAEQRIKEFRDLAKKFKSLTETGQLTVKIVDGQMVVALSSDVLFSPGSVRLSKEGIESIKQMSTLLASVAERKFQVQGFSDNIPIKTAAFPSNWELASARAMTVVKTMLEAGMPPERVSAASFGDTHPVKPNDSEEGRAANRRIEIVVVPDLSTLPGYDQLQKMSSP